MTAKDLSDKIQQLIEAEFKKMDSATRRAYIQTRKELLERAAKLWNDVSIEPVKSEEVGNIIYVSRAEANKYGRLEKLKADNLKIASRGALTDVGNIEIAGRDIYQLSHDGAAWVYSQGYGLPITGGAKVKVIAQTLYSDFYGSPFPDRLKKNWAKFIADINDQIVRDLNKGKSYSETAANIKDITNREYKKTLRLANTEGHRIQSAAQENSLLLLNEVGAEYEKVWQSILVGENRREDHLQMDGKEADQSGIFHLPSGATGPQPGLTGNASDDISCKCYSIVKINGELPTERRINGEIVPYQDYRTDGPSIKEIRKAV